MNDPASNTGRAAAPAPIDGGTALSLIARAWAWGWGISLTIGLGVAVVTLINDRPMGLAGVLGTLTAIMAPLACVTLPFSMAYLIDKRYFPESVNSISPACCQGAVCC